MSLSLFLSLPFSTSLIPILLFLFLFPHGGQKSRKTIDLLPYMVFQNLLHRSVNAFSFVSLVRSYYVCLLCIFLSFSCPVPKALQTHSNTYHLECSALEEERGTRRLNKFYQAHFLHLDICLPPVKSVKDSRTPGLSFGCG